MTHQHRALNAQRLAQCRQHVPGFGVQVVGLQAPAVAHVGHGVGLAITTARVDPAGASRRLAQRGGPVAPQGHAAQAFMQKNQRRAVADSSVVAYGLHL